MVNIPMTLMGIPMESIETFHHRAHENSHGHDPRWALMVLHPSMEKPIVPIEVPWAPWNIMYPWCFMESAPWWPVGQHGQRRTSTMGHHGTPWTTMRMPMGTPNN